MKARTAASWFEQNDQLQILTVVGDAKVVWIVWVTETVTVTVDVTVLSVGVGEVMSMTEVVTLGLRLGVTVSLVVGSATLVV